MNIPEGWKLVPVEPTPAMVEAAFDALPNSPLEGRIRTHYRHMLAAAPTPPAQDDERAPDPWHAAIDNELVCCHILNESNHNDPRKALQDIINWHVQVALDPAVSSDAQALIERGKQDDEALEVLRQASRALDEAADSIADWASYASDYFREKHDYEGDLKRTRDAAAHFRALIAKRGAA